MAKFEKGCIHLVTHGASKTRLHHIWRKMLYRCGNPKNKDFLRYGGRGIVVCRNWRFSFVAFRNWAMSNGYTDDLTIERIDVNGNYEPDNCTWITAKEQSQNRRSTIKVDGHSLKEYCRKNKLPYETIRSRITYGGLTVEQAVTLPIQKPGAKIPLKDFLK